MPFIAYTTRSGKLVAVLGWHAHRIVGVYGRAIGIAPSANDELPGAA